MATHLLRGLVSNNSHKDNKMNKVQHRSFLPKVLAAGLLCSSLSTQTQAQVGIGIASPDASAQLQIESTNKGVLIPRVTSTSVVSNPAKGLLVYQTGAPEGFYYNSGTSSVPAWVGLASLGAAGGDLTGTYPNPTIADNAVTSNKIIDLGVQNQDLAVNSVTTSKVANGTVTTSKMADSAISSLKLLTYAVTNRHLQDGAVTPTKISTTGATTNQVLGYDGTAVTWMTNPAGAVTTNNTLTGTGVSGSPLGINTGNSNTWTANQTFGGTFLITSNSRIAMTNSDNAARDLRFQEPSGSGSQFVGLEAPPVSQNSRYVFPAAVGAVGSVLAVGNTFSNDAFGDKTNLVWATPAGSSTPTLGYAGNTTGATIAVVLGGTNIPLPSNQNLSDVTANGTNDGFTVASAGRYRIEYRINLTSAVMAGSRVNINGAASAPLVVTPSTSTSSYDASAIVTLNAGDVVSLQLFGIIGSVTLNSNQGASLSMEKL